MSQFPFPPSPFPAAPPSPPAASRPSFESISQPDNLEGIVRIAHEQGFSDVHLGVGEEPRFRARGEMAGTG